MTRDTCSVPYFFGPADLPLFGWFHPGHSGGSAVVLCAPIGHESENTDSSYRMLAERLAARGSNVLRFHYHGTGDSAGEDGDPDRVEAWIRSVHVAIDEIKRRSGQSVVRLLGTRLGATLAITAAAERTDVEALAVVAPVVSGRRFLREMRATKLLWAQNHPEIAYAPLAGGDDEAGGYRFTRQTLASVQALDLTRLETRPAPLVLVVSRDDLTADDAPLATALERAGATVEHLPLAGYAAMQKDMPAPVQLLDVLASWLQPIADGGPGRDEPRVHASPGEAMRLRPDVDAHRTVVEAPLRLVLDDGSTVFAIVTRPEESVAPCDHAVVIWGRRRGPNRMYVPLARMLAMNGFTVMRVDLPGLGDSARPLGDEVNDLYTTPSLAAATRTLRAASVFLGARRVSVIGLCAAGYLAHHAGRNTNAVSDMVLINPPPLYWEHWRPETFFPRSNAIYWYHRYLARQSSGTVRGALALGRSVRHKLTLKNLVGLGRTISSRIVDPAARRLQRIARIKGGFVRSCAALRARGIRPLLVFSRRDPGLLSLLERHADAADHCGDMTLVDADHILLSVAAQEVARGAIVDHVMRIRSDEERRVAGTVPAPVVPHETTRAIALSGSN